MTAEPESWPPEVEAHLRSVGWTPDRRVDLTASTDRLRVDSGFALHPAAAAFLAEFGELDVPRGFKGESVAATAFHLEPLRGIGKRDWSDSVACPATGSLYPIGDAGGGHATLAIDECGTVFMLFGQECRRVGTGRRAIVNLVLGRRDP